MSRSLATMLLGAMLLPSLALADCPRGLRDLDTGIEIGFHDGTTSHYHRNASGQIIEQTEYNDGTSDGYRTRSLMGFVLLEIADTFGGLILPETVDRFEYPTLNIAPDEPPDIERQSVVMPMIAIYPDGERIATEVAFATGVYQNRTWGGCTYRVLPIEVGGTGAHSGMRKVYHYVPQLGFAVFVDMIEDNRPIGELVPGWIRVRAAPR